MGIREDITRLLLSHGAALAGFADLAEIPAEDRLELPFGISIAVALDPAVMLGIHDGPTAAYHEEYRNVNARLLELGKAAEHFLRQEGHRAALLDPTVGEDRTSLSTRLPHKTVATRAGLGWIGKCALLVTREYGSAVRLVTVLTDAPLETGVPANTSECGDCTTCVDACPAHAVTGRNWEAGLPRESLYDAHACRKRARELALSALGEEVSICGRCIVVCPWTREYLAGNHS